MEKIFALCRDHGIKDPEIIPLKGDYSMRRIYRVKSAAGTIIAVAGPDTKENEAFLSFRNTFEDCGFNVPSFIASNEDKSIYLLTDLGDLTVKKYCDEMNAKSDTAAISRIYRRILKELPRIQTVLFDKIDYSKCYQGDVFDRESMEKDTGRFTDYFLEKYHKNYDRKVFFKFKEFIIGSAGSAGADYFMYRDFQTRNIMIRDNELFYIDFQSGRKGPALYDLASFIYSSGTVNYEGMEEELSKDYYNSIESGSSYGEFRKRLNVFACLRIMQAAGNYAYYYYSRGDRTIESRYKEALTSICEKSEMLKLNCGFLC